MTLEQFKHTLKTVTEVNFKKMDGTSIPAHFHITEVGEITKKFIDCGGTVRNETVVSMQLWASQDFWHRIEPNKLLSIIDLSIKRLGLQNQEIEIEYQNETIGKYNVDFINGVFVLIPTKTACLAEQQCGIPIVEKVKSTVQTCCAPNSGCC